MLNAYITQVRQLLNDPNAQFYTTSDLTSYINQARGQIALQTQCIIQIVSYTVSASANSFAMSSVTPPANLKSLINVRTIAIKVGSTQRQSMEKRPWQWVSSYYINNAATSDALGKPSVWGQLTSGVGGTIYFSPGSQSGNIFYLESTWTPVDLVDDSTVEMIPFPWTDLPQYFAAYLALIQAQRMQDAQAMIARYEAYVQAARLGVVPGTLPVNYPSLKPLLIPMDPGSGQPAQLMEGVVGG